MNPRPYLPSAQFSFIVLSLLVASGLVYAAQTLTNPTSPAAIASAAPTTTSAAADHSGWEASLASIQAGEGSSSLPAAPDENSIDALKQSAATSNLTETLGRTLLINLTNAQSQGMGGDTPTQNSIITDALNQIALPSPNIIYTANDLSTVADSANSFRNYGDAVVSVLQKHPSASVGETLTIISAEINGDPSKLPQLELIAKEYRALAKDLAATPVPQSLAANHLQIMNDFEQMGETYPAMEAIQKDPAQGLLGLQQFNALQSDAQNMFINVAQAFNKNGILFNKKDDPQGLWASLLSG